MLLHGAGERQIDAPAVQLARVPVSNPPFCIHWVDYAVTVNVMVVLLVVEPEVPVTVTVLVPLCPLDSREVAVPTLFHVA